MGYLEYIGAGKMTIGMIMKASRTLTIRLEEDKQWRIRCEITFKAKSMKGFNTTIPGKVVENKYQSGVPEREALQDWDLREVLKQIQNKYRTNTKQKQSKYNANTKKIQRRRPCRSGI